MSRRELLVLTLLTVFFIGLFFARGAKDAAVSATGIGAAVQSDAEEIPDGAGLLAEDISNETDVEEDVFASTGFSYAHDMPEGDPVQFHEVWGYVLADRVSEFKPDLPITDLVYFSADLDCYGEFESIPKRSTIPADFKGRVHLSTTCSSRSLTHFVLDPQFGVNRKVVDALVKAMNTNGYDGINVDFELIPKRDAKHFHSFIRDLRKKMGQEKWLTIAVPARTKTLQNDAFDYETLAPMVDRIFIMAYDEHWSTSNPGAVASMDWCEKIADYAKTVIPKKKLVMGLPFYGRSWQDENYGKAWYFSGINRVLGEKKISNVQRENGVPYVSFKTEVNVTGYFDDTYSLVQRCRMYADKGINRIGFWRVGQ